ncbi:MAG: FmdB family zinc ribbon protein [Friedmanniella sp.]|jgi:putative FmdB family regulatory protein
MPTYQYRCTECGHDLEAVQKFSDAALTECPSCGGQLRKVYNAVGVVFKGSGFYRTDSRKVPAESSSSEGSSSGAKANGKESGDKGTPGKEKSGTGSKTPAKQPAGSGASTSGSGSSTTAKAAGS